MPNSFLNAFSQLVANLCVATNLCCQSSSFNSVEPDHFWQSRLASARYLIARAQKLEQINQVLLRLCDAQRASASSRLCDEESAATPLRLYDAESPPTSSLLCDAESGPTTLRAEHAESAPTTLHLEHPESAPTKLRAEESRRRKLPDKEAQQAFENVYQKYQVARTQYLEHRQEYDAHVKEFHQEAKQDNRALPPLTVPDVKPLKVQAEDQCRQLQIMEQQLKSSEEVMLNAIETLQSERSKTNPDVYFQRWINSQSMAMNVQNTAMAFNHGIAQKEQLTSEQLHAATQSAILDGDAIQSQKTYVETQRRTALANAEAQRAQLHSQLAAAFLIYINSLSPLAQRTANASTISPEQLERESNSLQTEYNGLQEQYSEVEKLNPAWK
jgi:hypothetical protein